MNYTLVIKESANQDVIDAFLYYENKLVGLGERFLKSWELGLEGLKKEPKIYQKKYKNFRQALLKPFPYHIIYEIEEDSVIIYKVSYAGRHPRKRFRKS